MRVTTLPFGAGGDSDGTTTTHTGSDRPEVTRGREAAQRGRGGVPDPDGSDTDEILLGDQYTVPFER